MPYDPHGYVVRRNENSRQKGINDPGEFHVNILGKIV